MTTVPATEDKAALWADGRGGLVEFARFIAIGSMAAVVNLVARYVFDFAMPFGAAVVLAYVCGMIVGFVLFQKLLFSSQKALLPRRLRRFCVVNLFGAALAWAISSAMAWQILPWIGWSFRPFEVAHFVGVAAPAISSYFLHKHYTFA